MGDVMSYVFSGWAVVPAVVLLRVTSWAMSEVQSASRRRAMCLLTLALALCRDHRSLLGGWLGRQSVNLSRRRAALAHASPRRVGDYLLPFGARGHFLTPVPGHARGLAFP